MVESEVLSGRQFHSGRGPRCPNGTSRIHHRTTYEPAGVFIMTESLAESSAEDEAPLETAKKELKSAWREEFWPEPVDGPDQLFHYCSADGLYGIVTGRRRRSARVTQ